MLTYSLKLPLAICAATSVESHASPRWLTSFMKSLTGEL